MSLLDRFCCYLIEAQNDSLIIATQLSLRCLTVLTSENSRLHLLHKLSHSPLNGVTEKMLPGTHIRAPETYKTYGCGEKMAELA